MFRLIVIGRGSAAVFLMAIVGEVLISSIWKLEAYISRVGHAA